MKTRKKQSRSRRNRPLHKRFLLHPITVFFWLCVGVALVLLTFKASADSYMVTGRVAGTPPVDPAVITSPADGTRYSSVPITVTGGCPINSYVNLTRNGIFSGTAICQVDLTFTIQTDLFPGANDLEVQDYNYADVPGPSSTGVTVYYDKPATPPPVPTSSSSGSGSGSGSAILTPSPLLVTSGFLFKGFYTGTQFSWKIQVKGGTPPYAVNVDWGDGQTSTYAKADESEFSITHKYSKPGGYRGSYIIKIQATDGDEASSTLQLVAIINDRNSPVGTTSSGPINTTPTSSSAQKWLRLMWPVYAGIAIMTASFWLGEQQALGRLFGAKNVRARRA